ncbi:transporter [Flavobacteriaceae bacterium]|nr:transporter [Flavobacteriaceae bacterium]MDC0506426.1 transporter [Flavobacteriaceae bacterium]
MKKIVLLILLISSIINGQIITDRPDQTEASIVLPKNILQIESGFSVDQTNTFNNLFRFGLSESVEIRLNTNYIFMDSKEGVNIPSPKFSDIELGTKIQLFSSEKHTTTVAFLSHISIPTASKYYTNDGWGTLNRILISHDLSQTLSIGYNLGYNKVYGAPDTFIYTLALAKSIGSWGVYAELFGENSKKESPNSYDLGLTYLIKENIQFDVSLGKGFNNKMDYFALGVSWNYDLNK